MQKERAASALKHGLPVPTPLPARARGFGSGSSRPLSGATSRTPVPSTPSKGLPLAVKLVGLGLGLLGLVYGLTLFRDHRASVEAALPASPTSAPSSVAPTFGLGASMNAASLRPRPASSALVK